MLSSARKALGGANARRQAYRHVHIYVCAKQVPGRSLAVACIWSTSLMRAHAWRSVGGALPLNARPARCLGLLVGSGRRPGSLLRCGSNGLRPSPGQRRSCMLPFEPFAWLGELRLDSRSPTTTSHCRSRCSAAANKGGKLFLSFFFVPLGFCRWRKGLMPVSLPPVAAVQHLAWLTDQSSRQARVQQQMTDLAYPSLLQQCTIGLGSC